MVVIIYSIITCSYKQLSVLLKSKNHCVKIKNSDNIRHTPYNKLPTPQTTVQITINNT